MSGMAGVKVLKPNAHMQLRRLTKLLVNIQSVHKLVYQLTKYTKTKMAIVVHYTVKEWMRLKVLA